MGANVTLNQGLAAGIAELGVSRRGRVGRSLRVAAALATASVVAACGGGGGSAAGSAAPSSGVSRWGALLAFGKSAESPALGAAAKGPQLRSCPEVSILDGGAALRVGGPASSAVRHQFAINDTARECQLQGNTLAIKVGVEGNLVIGPAGSGGTQSAGIKVAVRAEKDQKIISSRSYRVSATATGGEAAQFTLVTDTFTMPFLSEYSSDDYTIIVGFEGSRAASGGRRSRRR
jgi:hypothetical protein